MSEIKVDTLTGKTTANDITVTVGATATMSLEQGLAKQWVSFDPDDFNVDDSLNCTSISDGPNAGEQTPNFVNAMNNSDYVVNALVLENQQRILRVETRTTTSYTTQNTNDAGTAKDDLMGCLVHGDLA
jgi:hypothetical protein